MIPECSFLQVHEKQSMLEWLAANYKSFGCTLEFITNRSQEGSQFCRGFGGIGGLLRYQVSIRVFCKNSLQIKLQQPDVIAKSNTKITRNRVKPPFLGVFSGWNRVQVIQNNPQQAHFCNGFRKPLKALRLSVP
jgi:hypothetical protein